MIMAKYRACGGSFFLYIGWKNMLKIGIFDKKC